MLAFVFVGFETKGKVYACHKKEIKYVDINGFLELHVHINTGESTKIFVLTYLELLVQTEMLISIFV